MHLAHYLSLVLKDFCHLYHYGRNARFGQVGFKSSALPSSAMQRYTLTQKWSIFGFNGLRLDHFVL